jgi:threonine dehydrogenase-like Zn-dependent dehydrogenase
VAWHAVDTSPIEHGDSVLVLGGGPIGLGVIQCLKARGATTIIVAEVARERQNYAKMFGATHIFDPRSEDVVKKSKEICAGQGPKIAFDCAGVPSSIKTAVLAVGPRGTVVNVAIWEKEVPFQPNSLVFGEKRYLAGKCLLEVECWPLLTELVLGYQRNDYEGVIEALRTGTMKPEKMITSKIKIDRIVEDGFKPLIEEKDKHVKILVDLKT